jgi:MoxR-like ATPase
MNPVSANTLTDQEASEAQRLLAALIEQLGTVVVGQRAAIVELVTGLVADGHVLLEGVPGVAKTLLGRALAAALDLRFTRVQFTPDLMPTDLVGTRIYAPDSKSWQLHKGPVFTDVLLADEINRTPPKTQSALLEAMEERQVTIDGERHELGGAFFVIATENPLELEGTYPLPEAQTDRFFLKVLVGYPDADAELALLRTGARHKADLGRPLLGPADLAALRQVAARVRTDHNLLAYVLALLQASRTAPALRLGASPRAGLMLVRAAQVAALLDGRSFSLPDDVKMMARPVLRHRLLLSTEAQLDGLSTDGVLTGLLDRVPVLPNAT